MEGRLGMENRCHAEDRKRKKKGAKKGKKRLENEEEVRGFCASHGCRIKFSSCFLQQKIKNKNTDTEAHTNTHSKTTSTNSWRRRQTRRELISSPTRRGLQGEREREKKGRWRKT